MFKCVLLAAVVASAGAASAATIDFTDRSVWTDAGDSQKIAGSVATLSSENGVINFAQDFDRSGVGVCIGAGGGLACDSDGLGINGDEISTNTSRAQSVTLNFSGPVLFEGFSVLDLYVAEDGSEREVVEMTIRGNGGALTSFTYDAVQRAGGDAPGFAPFDFTPTWILAVTFRAMPSNDNLGVADFALASVNVSSVPLPAAAWMLVAGLGLLARTGCARRRA